MKILMYHYVRESVPHLPFFRYLSFDNFKKQLDYFEKNFGLVSFEEFCRLKTEPEFINVLKNKILLSFDDGLKEHFTLVYPELLKRGALGIFFMPTAVLKEEKALYVHKIHYLLGHGGGGGGKLLDLALKLVEPHMCESENAYLFEDYYDLLDDDVSVKQFKLLLNYNLKEEFKEEVLSALLAKCNLSEAQIYENYYLNREELKIMSENQMLIGSHAHAHINFLNLNAKQEADEVRKSFEILSFLDPTIRTFCYPYGEFSRNSRAILQNLGVDFAFVSLDEYKKDIDEEDLKKNPFTLSRYDCNAFKFGKASMG
ncbi:polysaccharide deacetylase family protein [Campylobacter upsaliensis]|uniref:polysaccharide deacetylase family protein n=2 Tax=Campylobacter upsaliensis TaxID=28080 RepID=UPI002B3DB905|nr:polysaccharide deacetylase family protein [Campylobacter upsaliensis]MEB2817975.1 polysaccharide deacetylase family protein [Campylobacter upsaliensis]